MHRFLNLLLNIITFSLYGKHHLQQIEITRHKSDSINGFNCTKITGAQANSNGACACKNAGTILSDKNGRLKCENLDNIFPTLDCDIEKNPNLSQTHGIELDFDNSLSCVATLHNSALWNINSKGGYWHYSNDIKTYLTINSQENQENLKVNNSNGQLNGLVLKLQFRCNSTSITKCVMLKIYGTRSYPVTQFNRSSISPIPTATLTTTPPTTLTTTATKTNTSAKIESTTTTTKTSTAAAAKTTAEAMTISTTIVTTPTKNDEKTTTKTTQPTSQTLKSNPMISATSGSDMTGSTSKNSTKTQGDEPIMQKLSDNSHSVTIAAVAASIAMLMSAILLLYLWRQRKKKKSLCEISKRSSTEVSPETEPDYLKPIDGRRNSQESTVYEIFGDEFASAVFRYVDVDNTQYKEITPHYQDVTPVYTSLSLNKPSPGKDHSNKRLEKTYRKMFVCPQDFTDKNISVALNLSLRPEDDELRGSDFSQYYQYFKPVFLDPPKSDQTFPEEHIFRELERPEGGDLIPPTNDKNKQALVPFNSLKQSDEQIRQYYELAAEYQDLKPVYIDLCKDNHAFVGKHVCREPDAPERCESPISPYVIYDTPL